MQSKKKPLGTSSASGKPAAGTAVLEESDDYEIVLKEPRARKGQATVKTRQESPFLYFTEKDLSRILVNLNALRDDVYPSET